MVPMDSASERYENARRALKEHGRADAEPDDPGSIAQLTLALRSLLKDPTEGYDVAEIAQAILPDDAAPEWSATLFAEVRALVAEGVQRGIYTAWETWEPADRPDQQTMLRWLGIEFFPDAYPSEPGDWGGESGEPMIFIDRQYIAQEEA